MPGVIGRNPTRAALGALLLLLTAPAAAAAESATAKAALINAASRPVGQATVFDTPNGLLVVVEASDLPPGPHGIHIHSVGTCADPADGFKASGGHFNPAGHKHGLMHTEGPEAGDLPNLQAASDGKAYAELLAPFASLNGAGGRSAILDADGAALVIHEKADDHTTQPIGGAAGRIACGVIERRQP